jgi:hypothetical protein
MYHYRYLLLSLSFSISTVLCTAQSLKVEIDSIYNFKPSKLSEKEQETKIPAIDKFWGKVKSDTSLYLPQLRTELISNSHNPYFYFDGSALLLSLAKNTTNKQLAANAIAKCDLTDINREAYTHTLNSLANDGINVTNAAMKILADKDFQFFIPQHVLTFDQSMSLTYALLPEKTEWYVDSLIARFKGANPKVQISILSVLFYAYTCKGETLIKNSVNDKSLSKEVRKTAKEMTSDLKLTEDETNYAKNIQENELENMRKVALQRFSDEAIDELGQATKILRKKVSCR